MFACYKGQRHPRASILDNLFPIDVQPRTTDLPTLQSRPSHSGLDALHNKRPFQFRNRRDNGYEKTAHGIPRCHALPAADELDSHAVQLVDYLEKIPRAPRNSVERCDQHDGALLPPCIGHTRIEPRTACLLTADDT